MKFIHNILTYYCVAPSQLSGWPGALCWSSRPSVPPMSEGMPVWGFQHRLRDEKDQPRHATSFPRVAVRRSSSTWWIVTTTCRIPWSEWLVHGRLSRRMGAEPSRLLGTWARLLGEECRSPLTLKQSCRTGSYQLQPPQLELAVGPEQASRAPCYPEDTCSEHKQSVVESERPMVPERVGPAKRKRAQAQSMPPQLPEEVDPEYS